MTAYEYTHRHTTHLHYEGKGSSGKQIAIDVAELSEGRFEVMALVLQTSQELECRTVDTLEQAEAVYHQMYRRHVPEVKAEAGPRELTGKYAQLRDDLKKALEAGRAAEDADPEDGGTCNLDAASLALPRWNAEKVKQAAKEAGTGCFTWDLFRSRRYVFIPNTRSQGNARSRNAEAMTAVLRSMGYDAMDYCQMD